MKQLNNIEILLSESNSGIVQCFFFLMCVCGGSTSYEISTFMFFSALLSVLRCSDSPQSPNKLRLSCESLTYQIYCRDRGHWCVCVYCWGCGWLAGCLGVNVFMWKFEWFVLLSFDCMNEAHGVEGSGWRHDHILSSSSALFGPSHSEFGSLYLKVQCLFAQLCEVFTCVCCSASFIISWAVVLLVKSGCPSYCSWRKRSADELLFTENLFSAHFTDVFGTDVHFVIAESFPDFLRCSQPVDLFGFSFETGFILDNVKWTIISMIIYITHPYLQKSRYY